MRAKIDINEVERGTKIRAKYLRAIENEEWDLLPGEVYVKSFLRTYGDFLGLDSRQLIDEYKRRYEHPTDHELRPIAPRRRERERERRPRGGPLVPPWALIGLVLVAVVAALYFVGRNKGGSSSTTTTHSSSTHSHHRAHGTTTRITAPKPVKTPPSTVKLQLVPTGEVYVCLVDGAGKPLIDGKIYDVGQTIPTERASKMMLTLGNASVKMKVNGILVAVTPSAGAIGYELTPSGHSTLPPAQQPRCA